MHVYDCLSSRSEDEYVFSPVLWQGAGEGGLGAHWLHPCFINGVDQIHLLSIKPFLGASWFAEPPSSLRCFLILLALPRNGVFLPSNDEENDTPMDFWVITVVLDVFGPIHLSDIRILWLSIFLFQFLGQDYGFAIDLQGPLSDLS